MINAGDLNLRIILQIPTISRGTDGAEIKTFITHATVWASKKHKTSREFYSSQKINAEITDLFVIRYRSGVTTRMRVSFDGKYYDILGADDPDGRRRELQLLCKEVT
jgi:SPP1 family predicted phage head-tail adaptor